jgi:hypothetical protein
MSVTRLSGGLTPGAGGDPRTFPAIWNATADYIENGFRFAGTVYFTSSGTFAKADPLGTGDIGLRAIRVRLVGGGGAGGGAEPKTAGTYQGASGGGGGGYAESVITDIAGLVASVTVTVGTGGTGVAGGTGNSGGNSSFGTAVVGNGGSGGVIQNSVGASLGGGGTGQLVINGSHGTFGTFEDDLSGIAVGGAGGSSRLGGSSGPAARTAGSSAGQAGLLYGGGGGGRVRGTNVGTGSAVGADGAAGIVIVDCFV